MKRELERIEIPGEHEARERASEIVRTAFRERVPLAPERHRLRLAIAIAVVAAVGAATLSSPGRAVLDEIREVVGVERAQPGLFSLPAPGRLLVASDSGVWVVEQNGSKRLLGNYREASWSPFGRFVVAVRQNELAALEPDGDVRWTLARPSIGAARWSGSRTDTRIAYVTRDRLHVVEGDGQGDRFLFSAPDVPRAPFAWKPGSLNLLAHSTQGILRLLDVQTDGEEVWSANVEQPLELTWTADGQRLVVLSPRSLSVFDARGRRVLRYALAGRAMAGAVDSTDQTVAVALRLRDRNRTEIVSFSLGRKSTPRRLFAGAGAFGELAWSPDGKWLLAGWSDADQWVLLRARGEGIRAVADVSDQFRSQTFPRVEGWCCAAD